MKPPLETKIAYDWLAKAIIDQLNSEVPVGIDTENATLVQKIFHSELVAFKKGGVSLLDADSVDYRTRVADEADSVCNEM